MIQLYRHYDAKGKLLYVGISRNAGFRFTEHRRNAAWAKISVRMTVEMFPDRLSASIAELKAVEKEKPLHNRNHLERACKAPPVLERPRRDEVTAMVSARLAVSVIEKINAHCRHASLSRSQIIEVALKKFLK